MTISAKARTRTHHQQRKRATTRHRLLLWFAAGLIIIGTIIVSIAITPGMGNGQTPDFVAETLSGDAVQLADYRGQVVMLNFWATWCPPCRAEMPTIKAAYQHYGDQGFNVLAINNAESPAQIRPFVDNLGLNFPIVLDTSTRLQNRFGITAYPTSIFIGPDGNIFAMHSGMLSASQLQDYIETGLSQMSA